MKGRMLLLFCAIAPEMTSLKGMHMHCKTVSLPRVIEEQTVRNSLQLGSGCPQLVSSQSQPCS